MSKKKRIGTGIFIMALGALVAATPRYLFPVCEYFGVRLDMGEGKTLPMGCYYTAQASLLLGIIIALAGIAVAIASKPEALSAVGLILAGAAVGVILVPTVLFPICHNPDMHCNNGTKPLLIVLGITTAISAGWLIISSRKSSVTVTEAAADTA